MILKLNILLFNLIEINRYFKIEVLSVVEVTVIMLITYLFWSSLTSIQCDIISKTVTNSHKSLMSIQYNIS